MRELHLPVYPALEAGWPDFVTLYAASYVALLIVYFSLGGLLQAVNRRYPERRIQQRPMKDQVAMEIRQSVVALATIALYVSGGLFAQAKGWTMTPYPLGWCSAPLTFLASLILYDAWFYWGHRMMHSKALYRFHAHHHKSIVPTPWSNNSDSLVGAFVEQSFFLFAPFFLPIPPEVLILHKIYDQITGMVGHAGHEYFASPTARWPWPMLCTTFHDQHHSYFLYNYANTFSCWDRWMGTIHPTYDDTVRQFEAVKASTPPGATDPP